MVKKMMVHTKLLMRNAISLLICAILIVISVCSAKVDYVKAEENITGGNVKFSISIKSDVNKVEWKTDLSETWNTVDNDQTLSADDLCTITGEGESATNNYPTKIYIKATPGESYKLDEGSDGTNYTQQLIRVEPASGGEGEDQYVSNLDSLKNGEYCFDYSTDKNYQVKISFDNDGGNNNEEGGNNNNNQGVTSGKYKVRFSDKTGQNCSVYFQFRKGDGDENKVGEKINVNSDIAESDIPEGATFIEILVAEQYRPYLKGIRVFCKDSDEHIENDAVNWGACIYEFKTSESGIDGIEIEIEFSNTKNIRWRNYDDPEAADDEKVENAHIYLLNSSDPNDKYTSGELGTQSESGGGDFNLTVGDTYYFLLEPDYGYQINTIRINDCIDLTPIDGSTGVFSFVMQNSNFHFKGIVSPTNNPAVEYTGSNISNPTLSADQNSGIHGNIEMKINDTLLDNAAASAVESDGVEALSSINIETYQLVSKGPNNGNWVDQKKVLNGDVNISIDIPASGLDSGETYSVVREHDGTREEINAVYNSTTGKLSFSSNKFSTYTIVKKPGTPETSVGPSEEPGSTTSPSSSSSLDENDDEGPSSTVTTETNTTLGTVVGGSDVKDWNGLEKILENKTSIGDKTTVGNSTATAPIVLKLNQRNSTVPASTLKALEASESLGLHLMMGNGAAITIANGAGLKNQPAINLSNKVETTRNSKTISFASNTKLNALVALHMSVPKNVKEVKLYYYINGHAYFLGTLTTLNGQVLFPISQLGIYKLVY